MTSYYSNMNVVGAGDHKAVVALCLTASKCEAPGLQLLPMVVETLAGRGSAAQTVIKRIARMTAAQRGTHDSVEIAHCHQSLGIILQRYNARAMLARRVASDLGAAAPAISSLEAALAAPSADASPDCSAKTISIAR